jgi:hypothetical protein
MQGFPDARFPGTGALAMLAAIAAAAALPAQEPTTVETHHPDGRVKERFAVDELHRMEGRWESFHANGQLRITTSYHRNKLHGGYREFDDAGRRVRFANYQDGVLHGRFEEFHPDGRTALAGDYKNGKRHGSWIQNSPDGATRRVDHWQEDVLHGQRSIDVRGKVVTRQTWRNGELIELDDLQPFPVPRADLQKLLGGILAARPTPIDPQQDASLRRLQAYRALCGLDYAEMTLVPEWNVMCDAAAEICRRNGGLDHTPPQPKDMPQDRYQLGYQGASHSNLHAGGGMLHSVDGFMDDSDPSNIDRLGHRRWCLNPTMKKTAFGEDEGYSAMWSFDQSGQVPKGLRAVLYPPRGWCPVEMFSARHAWSIQLVRGSAPPAERLQVRIRALDADWLPAGEPLPLDYCSVAPANFGGYPCLIFRPVGLEVAPGRAFLAEVSTDSGKTFEFRYVVAFCTLAEGEPTEPPRDEGAPRDGPRR